MSSMWQRRYAGSVRQASRDIERFCGKVEWPEEPPPAIAYRCVEGGCGYFEAKYVEQVNGVPRCPGCGATMQQERLFASCPRCGKEHNIVFALQNMGFHNPDTGIPMVAAKTLCHECKQQRKRLPKQYQEKGATIAIRREIIGMVNNAGA